MLIWNNLDAPFIQYLLLMQYLSFFSYVRLIKSKHTRFDVIPHFLHSFWVFCVYWIQMYFWKQYTFIRWPKVKINMFCLHLHTHVFYVNENRCYNNTRVEWKDNVSCRAIYFVKIPRISWRRFVFGHMLEWQ